MKFRHLIALGPAWLLARRRFNGDSMITSSQETSVTSSLAMTASIRFYDTTFLIRFYDGFLQFVWGANDNLLPLMARNSWVSMGTVRVWELQGGGVVHALPRQPTTLTTKKLIHNRIVSFSFAQSFLRTRLYVKLYVKLYTSLKSSKQFVAILQTCIYFQYAKALREQQV